jgi:hypothetical protein
MSGPGDNPLMASMMTELPGPAGSANVHQRVSAATPVITIDRTVRLASEQGGEYTCFEVTVSVSQHSWVLRKRYSEFEELYRHLFASHSKVVAAERWPSFPEKTWLSRFDQALIETRRQALQVFLQACVARTLYPVVLDKRLRAFLSLDEELQRAVELEAAEAAAQAGRSAATAAQRKREVQRKRLAHSAAVQRERDHSRRQQPSGVGREGGGGGGSTSSTVAAGGLRVSSGVVVATPLVAAHRQYVEAGVSLAAAESLSSGSGRAAGARYSALCNVWGVQPSASAIDAAAVAAAAAAAVVSSEPAPPTAGPSSAIESGSSGGGSGGGSGGDGAAGSGVLVCCALGGLALLAGGAAAGQGWRLQRT